MLAAAIKKARSWISAKDSRSALAGEQLNGPGHLFRRPYLHIIVWSSIQQLYSEEPKVFQACACGEQIRILKKRQESWPILLVCVPWAMIQRDRWRHAYLIARGDILGVVTHELLRKRLPRMFSVIKNESLGIKDDQIPS